MPYTTVRTEVPNSIFKCLSPATVDDGLPAWVLPSDRLKGLIPNVMGNTLNLNTRSAQALKLAGVPRSAWNAVNRTGQETFESMLSGQLQRNGLTSEGIAIVRRSGGP